MLSLLRHLPDVTGLRDAGQLVERLPRAAAPAATPNAAPHFPLLKQLFATVMNLMS
jgi:hypothetical protein